MNNDNYTNHDIRPKTSGKPKQHVYLLERRAIVKVAGKEMIHSDYSGFAGVFDSEKAAMIFAEAVTESLTRSSGRTFTLEAAEKKGERQRFVFRQAEKTLYPVFRFTCTREEVCGRI